METTGTLGREERLALLRIAREAIEQAVLEGDITLPELTDLPPALQEIGASFVTITLPGGELRGCIGGLEAREPLAVDVAQHAAAAALDDPRFLPVSPEEIDQLRIEVSRLTPPIVLEYERPEDLPRLLRPHIDGVVLRDSGRRATFLPQVWEKIADPEAFLSQLCEKMGAPASLWRWRKLQVETYQVEEFAEQA